MARMIGAPGRSLLVVFAAGGEPPGTLPLPEGLRRPAARTWHWLAIAYIAVIALMWTISMLSRGTSLLWPAVGSIVLVAALPLIDRGLGHAVRGLVDALVVDRYRPLGVSFGGARPPTAPRSRTTTRRPRRAHARCCR